MVASLWYRICCASSRSCNGCTAVRGARHDRLPRTVEGRNVQGLLPAGQQVADLSAWQARTTSIPPGRFQCLHQACAGGDQLQSLVQRKDAGQTGGGVLSQAVSQHRTGCQAVVLPQSAQADLQAEQGRLDIDLLPRARRLATVRCADRGSSRLRRTGRLDPGVCETCGACS